MAGTWRVLIEELHDLGTASYRVGDHLKLIGHSLQGGDGHDPHLRNLVVEVKSGTKTMRTQPFSAAVGQSDVIQLNQVLFVPHPPLREGATLRVLKLHKHQSDALVGEATIAQPKGAMNLKLMRRGAQQGVAMVTVTTGLPTMKPKMEAQDVHEAVPSLSSPPMGSERSERSERRDASGVLGIGEESMKSGRSHQSSDRGAAVADALASKISSPPSPLSQVSSVPPIPDERTPQRALPNGTNTKVPTVPGPLPARALRPAPAEGEVAEQQDIFAHLMACSMGILKGAAELCTKEESRSH